jgi:hypothetical protein
MSMPAFQAGSAAKADGPPSNAMAADNSSAAATVDAAAAGAAAAADAGGPLPRVVALGDSVLFWWCGRIVSLARGRGTLEAGDAAAAMPPGSRADIKAQVGGRSTAAWGGRGCIEAWEATYARRGLRLERLRRQGQAAGCAKGGTS